MKRPITRWCPWKGQTLEMEDGWQAGSVAEGYESHLAINCMLCYWVNAVHWALAFLLSPASYHILRLSTC